MASSSLAARRRQNMDGPRRVTFSENTSNNRLYDYSEDEDEEEQERALSELHGEAEEGGGGNEERKRKKEETDKDIAQELDQEVKKKIKKPRPRLMPSHLTSAEGLIRLPVEMKQIKYKPKKGKKRDILAAAAYSKNLINAYQSFCDDLFPSLAFEDVLLKIEQLGSKKEVKTFVQHMRDEVRNKHLEKLYGREKAEKMLMEVDEHTKQHQNADADENGGDVMDMQPSTEGENQDTLTMVDENTASSTSNSPSSGERVSSEGAATSSFVTPTVARASSDALGSNSVGEESEREANFEEESPTESGDKEPDSAPQEEPSTVNTGAAKATSSKSRLRIDESDDEDEEEATFDNISTSAATEKGTDIPGQENKSVGDDATQEDAVNDADLKKVDDKESLTEENSANESNEVLQNNDRCEDGNAKSVPPVEREADSPEEEGKAPSLDVEHHDSCEKNGDAMAEEENYVESSAAKDESSDAAEGEATTQKETQTSD